MRSAGWLWAAALILSAPAAAIEPDVTGSTPQTQPLYGCAGRSYPACPSISPELLAMLSARVFPTALGPYSDAALVVDEPSPAIIPKRCKAWLCSQGRGSHHGIAYG